MKLVFLFLLLVSSIGFADSDPQLSKSDFTKLMDMDQITFEKGFLFPLEEKGKDGKLIRVNKNELIKMIKSRYPTAKDEYFYVPYKRTNRWQYTIFYEWPNRKCYFRAEEFERKDGKMLYKNIDPKGEQVDIKYCEKAYGVKIN